MIFDTPCGRVVEYAHRFPACHMRRLRGCPDGSASMAWENLGQKPPQQKSSDNKPQYKSKKKTRGWIFFRIVGP